MELLPENAEILELYRRVKAFGPDMVFQFTDIVVNKIEAEEMLERLDLIDLILSEIRASLNDD